MLSFRAAVEDDVPLLAELNAQLLADEQSRTKLALSELRARMAAWLATGEYQAVIFSLRATGDPVAYAVYREEDATTIYIRQFFVHRDYRRQGIGRAAIDLLLSEVLPLDKRITLDVLCHNERAVAFWQAVGFQPYFIRMEKR